MSHIKLETVIDFADQMLDAVFLVDIDGRISYVSAACLDIFGYRPEEMIGRHIVSFVAPADLGRTLEEASKVIAGERRVGFENRYLRKDGSEVRIMWSARWVESERLRIGVAREVRQAGRGDRPPAPSCDLLTERQKEVLLFLSRGLTYREIAERLGVKVSTVATHVKSIYDRLGVSNKAEALFESRVLGLLG